MYNKGIIIPGLLILVLFVTFPIWFNGFTTAGDLPKPELPPGGEKECVMPADYMRANHMKLLNEWRDNVIRDGNREILEIAGVKYPKGLQTACMKCHTQQEKFCDSCHIYVAVETNCWECHLTPDMATSKEATH